MATDRLSPMGPDEDAEDDPNWQPKEVETWGSSSDDDDTDDAADNASIVDMAIVPSPVVSHAPQTNVNGMPSEGSTDRPKLSMHRGILASQNRWAASKAGLGASNSSQSSIGLPNSLPNSGTGSPQVGNGQATSTSGSSSTEKKETAVPLPPHPIGALTSNSANTVKSTPHSSREITPDGSGSLKRSAEYQLVKPAPPPVTPVPLPETVRESFSHARIQDVQKASSTSSTSPAPAPAPAPTYIPASKFVPGTVNKTRSLTPREILKVQLPYTPGGKPYTLLVDRRGLNQSAKGALIPDDYEPHSSIEFPFICPIRHCRRTLPNLLSLAGHFGGAHRLAMVNDNLDGTFTQIDQYKNTSGSSPCIVVSQNPPPADAAPPVEPRLPDAIAAALAKPKRNISGQVGSRPQLQPQLQPLPRYQHLNQQRQSPVPTQRGPLQPQSPSTTPNPYGSANVIANQAAFSQPATMDGTSSPFGRQSPGHMLPAPPVAPVPIPRQVHVPRPIPSTPKPSTPTSPAGSSPYNTEQTLAGRRSIRKSVLARLQADKGFSRLTTPSPSVQDEPGQGEDEDDEMEDWEIAPGRVTSSDSLQNVAYSGAFLASATPIAMSPDIWFNVLTIRPGQIHHVPEQRDRMQLYSVASGKVKVTTGGQVVQLGPNGAFPVQPGEQCVIENRLYSEATLHCTTVRDYEYVQQLSY